MTVLTNSYISDMPDKKFALLAPLGYRVSRKMFRETVATMSVIVNNAGINSRIIQNIIEYKNLEDNWDFDNAKSPTDKVIQTALYISRLLQKYGQKIYHSAPGPNGEILLDIRHKNKSKSFEIIIYDHKTNIVFIPEDDVLPNQEDFDEKDVIRYISWLK